MKISKPRLNVGDTLISRYEIIDQIGQGGMQQVFLTHDRALNRSAALKVPINASAQKRFERSARLSANIVHPNIAKTLDYGASKDLEFLVEEFIPGENLQQRLDEDFLQLDPLLAAHLTHHLVKAVAAMNAKGIIHRDLKPSNIMVSSDLAMLDVKVTDFGVATMAQAEIHQAVQGGMGSIAASKTVVGALAFMAPELMRKDSTVDRSKCDVWSIGALLYFLLFNEYPFGEDLAAIQNVLNGTLPNPTAHLAASKSQFRPLVESLWGIARKCLTISVDSRPTAAEISSLFASVTYSCAPRVMGRIKYLKDGPGSWGFIRPDEGGEDVFFHFDSYIGGPPSIGQRVMFADYPGNPQRRAHPIVAAK